jgi:LacI family transcriptional regulator
MNEARATRGPLLRDVARAAGVATGTVSNVLHNPDKVAPETRARVEQAIVDLGYVPNAAAQQLSRGRSGSVGLLVLDIRNPFFSELATGVEDMAADLGITVLLASSAELADRERLHLERFEQSRMDGILITPVGATTKQLKGIRDRGTPIVLLDRLAASTGFSSVAVDDVEGGRLAGQHLLDAGCRRIAFVGGPLALEQVRNRLTGIEKVARRRGARVTHLATGRMTAEEGRRVGLEIVAMAPAERPDGVFAANDVLGLAVLQALLLGGIRVPEEVAVIGYDDISFASLASVPLSSVRQPTYQMARRAMEMLAEMIAEGGPAGVAEHVVFIPELVARASTLRVAGRP